MLDHRRLAAASLACLLACTASSEPVDAADLPAVDRDRSAAAAVTLAPRPPRPPIVGATVASSLEVKPGPRCDDRPARLELAVIDTAGPPTPGRMVIERGDRWYGLPLRETRHDTVVVGDIAETSVIQVFYNPEPGPVTALYSFPLPLGGVVDQYTIRLAGRELHGVVTSSEDARALQAQARAAPALSAPYEQLWPVLFTQTIADVPPGATVEVELRLVAPLRRAGGRHQLVLPMTFDSREFPGDPGATDSNCSPVDVQVTIEAGVPVKALSSTYHAVTVETAGDRTRLELARGVPRPSHDLELSWPVAGPEPRAQLFAQKTDDGAHFRLTIEPPEPPAQAPVRPRELVFALDTSASMQGEPFEIAVEVIRRALVTMGPDDTLKIVRLTTGRPLAPTPLRNTPADVSRAVAYLTRLQGDDDTETLAGVTAALARKPDPERLRIVVFLTDGLLGDAAEVLTELTQRRGDARLFALGLGSARNHELLDGIARIGRGVALHMRPDERWSIADRLQQHIGAPIWTDLEIDWGDLPVADVTPTALPDLFAGQPVVVHGRFTGTPTGEATLRAKLGGATIETSLRPEFRDTAAHAGLRAMWARQHIDALLAYPNSNTSPRDPRTLAAAIELAIAHRVTTAYTSLVTLETRAEQQPDGTTRTVQVPVAPPRITSELADPIDPVTPTGSGYGRGGSGIGGRTIRVPTVRQARADVTGTLDRDIVRRIVRAHINEVRNCYDIGLARDSNQKGRIAVEFTIDPKGKVRSAVIKEDTMPDKIIAPCILTAVRRWQFPKPEGGSTATVVYPFVLEPG